MKLAEFVGLLDTNPHMRIEFVLPLYENIPDHFHITEVGIVQKSFVDCGGVVHDHEACVMQIWVGDDVEHRLKPEKLSEILKLGHKKFLLNHLDVEVEYGSDVIRQYFVSSVYLDAGMSMMFMLESKKTICLAPDKCVEGGCC